MNKSVIVAGVFAAAIAISTVARAQFPSSSTGSIPSTGNIEGITVTGKGAAAALPNLLEIDLEVSSSSELTADAIVKYRDAKRRLTEAFDALKLENLEVAERGLLVDRKGQEYSPYYYYEQSNTRTKTEVELSRKLIVECRAIRDLDEDAVLQLVAKLLDVAQDAGGQVGGSNNMNSYYYYRYDMQPPANGLIRFVLDDFDALQERAYELAVADARTHAERLAKLSGVTLGPVVAIREVVVPGDSRADSADDSDPEAKKRIETSKYQAVPVKVELLVRFAVGPAAPAPAAEQPGGGL